MISVTNQAVRIQSWENLRNIFSQEKNDVRKLRISEIQTRIGFRRNKVAM